MTATKVTIPDVDIVLDAMETFIKQRPGLDPANYGLDREQWRYSSSEQRKDALRSYRQEVRDIGKDRKRALKALQSARNPYTWMNQPDLLAEAFSAFSGRLQWDGEKLNYCTGQYFCTEYRKAAATVLERYVSLCWDRETAKQPAKEYTYQTLSDVKAANRESGGHWFDKSTMRFFNTRMESQLYGGRYFITSERYDENHGKRYSIRQAMPDGSVDTVGEFQQYFSLESARIAVRLLVNEAR